MKRSKKKDESRLQVLDVVLAVLDVPIILAGIQNLELTRVLSLTWSHHPGRTKSREGVVRLLPKNTPATHDVTGNCELPHG